jgi:hypothetical protein
MFVASDNINGVAGYEWKTTGDKGAIEIPNQLGHQLINRQGGHYWAIDGTKPIPTPEPEAEPEVALQEDESTGNDILDAIDAANVGVTKKASRARKSTAKE